MLSGAPDHIHGNRTSQITTSRITDTEQVKSCLYFSVLTVLAVQCQEHNICCLTQCDHIGAKECFSFLNALLYLTVKTSRISGCGIDIVAQPPGKKLQLLSLLSGGERALTAIAILFAMLDIRPSPFCILDEIEAALDEANVANFADYLKQYSHDTQFIVVTHRKGTMERCDALYGVAMEEKGVSRMVSVQLSELQKQLEDESNDLEQ